MRAMVWMECEAQTHSICKREKMILMRKTKNWHNFSVFAFDSIWDRQTERDRKRWKQNHKWRKVWKIVFLKKVINKHTHAHTYKCERAKESKRKLDGIVAKGNVMFVFLLRLFVCLFGVCHSSSFSSLSSLFIHHRSILKFRIFPAKHILNKGVRKQQKYYKKRTHIHRSQQNGSMSHENHALQWHNSSRA